MRWTNRTRSLLTLLALLPIAAAAAAGQHHNGHDPRALSEDPAAAEGPIAPRLTGLGEHHHPVTTSSEEAQAFFDQGLKLTYGFNHQEALRAFKEAARLDPECAMAYWGWALVLGPNLNLPMSLEAAFQAHEAIQEAMDRRHLVSERERAYIEALALRYSDDPEAERAPLDAAYAEAMGRLHRADLNDTDAATLYAAALMNLSPWNYWTRDGRPRERTEEIATVLRGVLKRDSEHEGALHYYIHLVEPVDPEAGISAADRLRGLAPGAGHLVHMPSHIYMQVGRYDESFELNRLAAEADEGYLTQCRRQGIYALGYYPHNVHFQAWAAILQGRSSAALELSRKVASKVPADLEGNDWAIYETFLAMPLYTMVRFGMWDEVLAEPGPPAEARYLAGVRHYARALAYIYGGRLAEARRERDRLRDIARDPATYELLIGFADAGTLLRIADDVVAGELAAAEGDYDRAIRHLDRAVRLEDSLLYNEPPDWFYPVRHTLGAVLLEAGSAREAEVVYWQDLERHPENGYALLGLAQTYAAQGREEEAEAYRERYHAAWAKADRQLTTSRF